MPSSTFHTTVAANFDTPKNALQDPPIEVPKAFGVTVMATEIKDNTITFAWIFVNRTDDLVEVTWKPKSHPLEVTISDGKGKSWHINDYMPPPPDTSAPVSIRANSENARVFVFQPSTIPDLDLKFDPADAPYSVAIELNSDSVMFKAVAGLKFPPPPPAAVSNP